MDAGLVLIIVRTGEAAIVQVYLGLRHGERMIRNGFNHFLLDNDTIQLEASLVFFI
jgi:hypothetical protein